MQTTRLSRLILAGITWLFGLVCFSSLAQLSPANEDCVSINQQAGLMVDYIEQAPYRQAIPSKLASFAYSNEQSYQDYLDYAQKLIAQRNPRAMMACPISTPSYQRLAQQQKWLGPVKVIQLLAPFELHHPNNDKAVLLIHGLTDSPFHFHDLAWFFYQQGYDVRTLLLPGHGTAPSDLVNTDYRQWQQAADYAISRSSEDYSELYLGGFSTGGALILRHLLKHPKNSEQVKGLLLWSPASKAASNWAWLAKPASWFRTWLSKDADIDFAKYESFATNAGAQVYSLMKLLGKELKQAEQLPAIPLLMVASQYDQTINTQASLAILQRWQQANPQLQHQLIYYGDQQSLPAGLSEQVQLNIPRCATASCEQIQQVAHTATINAPSNPYYGENGVYRNCSHYLKDIPSYLRCKQNNEVVKGETRKQNLQRYATFQRLTYNPYYQQMLQQINAFMQP
ncbi:alpha/beta hydrolase [Agarivorans sp.]|uniref:alpha/beta hydrolase n=1 Tax=Agarivorans sp. TaxID=1872412 RepID=UPI003D002EBE